MMILLAWILVVLGARDPPMVTVTIFDVGQGDSMFIEWRNGMQVLVDGGPSSDVLSSLGRTMLPWDRRIDYLVLTHPHADHVRGLLDVIERFEVGAIVLTGVPYSTDWYDALMQQVSDMRTVRPWELHEELGDRLTVLYPQGADDFINHPNVNESSVVLRVEGPFPMILAGDAGVPVEKKLLDDGRVGAVAALKVGHQGSVTSSSAAWLERLHPQAAIVTVGEKNRYGHPHQVVLDRLARMGTRVWRTDHDGTIRLRVFVDRLDIHAGK